MRKRFITHWRKALPSLLQRLWRCKKQTNFKSVNQLFHWPRQHLKHHRRPWSTTVSARDIHTHNHFMSGGQSPQNTLSVFFLKCTIPAPSSAIECAVYVAAREQVLPELCEKSRANLIRAAIMTVCRPAGASLCFFTAAHRSPPVQPSSHRHAPDMNEASSSMVSMNYWGLVVRLEATLYSICFAAAFRFLALTHLNHPSPRPPPIHWPTPLIHWPTPLSLTALQQKWKETLLLQSQYSSA